MSLILQTAYAEEFNLNWEVEPLEENLGGRIVISEIMNDYDLFINLEL